MPGKKYASIKRPKVYEALRHRGYSKQAAARISNAIRRTRTSSRMRTTGRRTAGSRKTKRANRRRRR